ncbi:MAG: RNA polymerase sigma factor [Pseudonocardia sp.]
MHTAELAGTVERDTAEPDVTELLRRAAAGHQGAWAELTRRYTPLLRARARRYRLQEADELDAIQTTWLRLAENVHRIHTPKHLAGWLATVISRECLLTLRRSARTVLADEVVLSVQDAAPGPEQTVIDAYSRAVVRDAVAELPPQRQALLGALFAGDGKPYTQIARDVGMPSGSLGPTRARTLTELRRILEQRGLTAA